MPTIPKGVCTEGVHVTRNRPETPPPPDLPLPDHPNPLKRCRIHTCPPLARRVEHLLPADPGERQGIPPCSTARTPTACLCTRPSRFSGNSAEIQKPFYAPPTAGGRRRKRNAAAKRPPPRSDRRREATAAAEARRTENSVGAVLVEERDRLWNHGDRGTVLKARIASAV